jgi:hypothetical protein
MAWSKESQTAAAAAASSTGRSPFPLVFAGVAHCARSRVSVVTFTMG